jgi:glutamine cyclotransferase
LAQAPAGPYSVTKKVRVGGEGGTDYIYADVAGRRLYISRKASRAIAATDTTPAIDAMPSRITVFNLDTLESLGSIPDTGSNGVAVDPKSGHGFSSSKPVTMFDTKTMQVIKTIDVGAAAPDGIYSDPFDGRIYVYSHPTKDATVIDPKDGTVLGVIDLGGVPEQSISDGKGTLYVVMQDRPEGSVAVVDVKTMKTTAHYPFGVNGGGCNGLALDDKNHILFAACGTAGNPSPSPAVPTMVILSATDGKILTTLPLAGGSDGAVFNPATMEAFSSQSGMAGSGATMTIVKEKSPTTFEVEQNLVTNAGRTCTLDTKTNNVLSMGSERAPAPATPPPAAAPPAGGRAAGPANIPGSFSIFVIGKSK